MAKSMKRGKGRRRKAEGESTTGERDVHCFVREEATQLSYTIIGHFALGACETKEGLAVLLKSGRAYQGRLVVDIPRHRLYMGFEHDWPRMNTPPEWFTVEPDKVYVVRTIASGLEKAFTGKQLHDGLPVELLGGEEIRLLIKR